MDKTLAVITDSISLDTMLGVSQHSRKKKKNPQKTGDFCTRTKMSSHNAKTLPELVFFWGGDV